MILIVEDNPVDSRIIEGLLKRTGHAKLQTVTNAEEALCICAETTPDLIIADLHLPQMNGVELCSRLQEKESPCCDIPVVFVSASSNKFQAQLEALAAGAKRFFTKPFNHQAFSTAVDTCLSMVHSQRKVYETNKKILKHLS